MGGHSKKCEGYTLSGQPCRRRIPIGQHYCSSHSRAAEIGLPPFISITPTESFWIFMPMGQPDWHVGGYANVTFKCLSTDQEYSIDRYVSEGTYGAVYFGSREIDAKQVAIKVSKEIYRNNSRRRIVEFDFVKEFYMHSAVRDRVKGNGVVVKMVDAFFIKTTKGLHGCIAMEKMDGNLEDLFDHFEGLNQVEVLRFWIYACNFIAGALLQLHANDIYHLDIKPSNVLWRRTRGQGRGIYLRLVDLGLGCYLGKIEGRDAPKMPCNATGTYIPVEWRKDGDKSTPTFEEIEDPKKLQSGETYALFVTCHKMLRRVMPRLYSRNARIGNLIEIINRGMVDSPAVRGTVSIGLMHDYTAELLSEMDAALSDMDDSLIIILPHPTR